MKKFRKLVNHYKQRIVDQLENKLQSERQQQNVKNMMIETETTCPACKEKIVPEYTDSFLKRKEIIEREDLNGYIKAVMKRSFDHRCPKCNQEFDIPREMDEIECPECKKNVKPKYTESYLEKYREFQLKGVRLANDSFQCPLCNTIFYSPVMFDPVPRPVSKPKQIWEKTKGWFRKFLP